MCTSACVSSMCRSGTERHSLISTDLFFCLFEERKKKESGGCDKSDTHLHKDENTDTRKKKVQIQGVYGVQTRSSVKLSDLR